MIKFHTNHGNYNLKLRAAYGHIKSEAKFREVIEKSIAGYEARQPLVGKSLRNKWDNGKEFEVLSYFGMLTWKERI